MRAGLMKRAEEDFSGGGDDGPEGVAQFLVVDVAGLVLDDEVVRE